MKIHTKITIKPVIWRKRKKLTIKVTNKKGGCFYEESKNISNFWENIN